MKKLTFEEIKNRFNETAYRLIIKEHEYLLGNQKLTVADNLGYLYSSLVSNIKPNKTLERFNTCNPYTLDNIKLWCKLNNKPFKLLDNQIYVGCEEKLKWKCFKENCGEIFSMTWKDIIRGHGCGVCHGMQVCLSNCLATINPELAKEWHPTKNGDLTPYDVTTSSHIEVWWQCKDNPKHEWHCTIKNRYDNDSNCPYCSGRYPSEDYNLLITNPNIYKEWNYSKNDKNPEDYCPNSHDKVWIKCIECGYEWEPWISTLSEGVFCPECKKPKGEKEIDNVLLNNNWIKISQEEFEMLDEVNKYNIKYYIPQKTFKGLLGVGNRLLSYDHYIPKLNLLIEFQGGQHEKYCTKFHKSIEDFEKQMEHDKRKREYAKNNNIKLLEIWYYDLGKVDKILDKYI